MKNNGDKQQIIKFKSSVGIEEVNFCNGGITLQGKVEIYLMDILNQIT